MAKSKPNVDANTKSSKASPTPKSSKASPTPKSSKASPSKVSPTPKESKVTTKAKKTYPYVFDFRRPFKSVDDEIALAKAVYVDGKRPEPNAGCMTAKQFGDAHRARVESEENGEYGPAIPPLYSFIRRQIAADFHAECIISGQKAKGKKPQGLPEKITKSWGDCDRCVPPLRLCHKRDARDLVQDRANNVLTIGKSDFVVGTTETPAAFLINGSTVGNYGANIINGKMASFDGKNNILASLVGRFNNGFDKIVIDDGSATGATIAVMPNQIITGWGYFVRGNKRMTVVQIRAAVAKGETSDMKFDVVYSAGDNGEQLVGSSLTRNKIWQESKKVMGRASTRHENGTTTALDRFEERSSRSGKDATAAMDRCWHNIAKVQTRTRPSETFPFGTFNLQTMIVPVCHFGDTLDKCFVRFILGAYVGEAYSENRWEANARLHPEDYEVQPDAKKVDAKKVDAKKVDAKKVDAKKVDVTVSPNKNEPAADLSHVVDDIVPV